MSSMYEVKKILTLSPEGGAQQRHNSLRKQKISDCFMIGIEFQNESFVLKAIKCLSDFINQEYSTKPWNHCNHFEEFIATK